MDGNRLHSRQLDIRQVLVTTEKPFERRPWRDEMQRRYITADQLYAVLNSAHAPAAGMWEGVYEYILCAA